MSHEATNWALKQRGLLPGTKLVLWYLADRYHPDHGCFPRQSTLAYDCEMSRSTVNVHLIRLEEAGVLRREQRWNYEEGRADSTLYILGCTPEYAQDPGEQSPESGHSKNPKAESGNRADQSPESNQSRVRNPDPNLVIVTSNRTSKARSREKPKSDSEKIKEILEEFAEPASVLSFCMFRKVIKKPLTITAAKRIAATLVEIRDKGGDPDDALGMCEEKGWQSILPDWYFRNKVSQKTADQKQLEEFKRLAGE